MSRGDASHEATICSAARLRRFVAAMATYSLKSRWCRGQCCSASAACGRPSSLQRNARLSVQASVAKQRSSGRLQAEQLLRQAHARHVANSSAGHLMQPLLLLAVASLAGCCAGRHRCGKACCRLPLSDKSDDPCRCLCAPLTTLLLALQPACTAVPVDRWAASHRCAVCHAYLSVPSPL